MHFFVYNDKQLFEIKPIHKEESFITYSVKPLEDGTVLTYKGEELKLIILKRGSIFALSIIKDLLNTIKAETEQAMNLLFRDPVVSEVLKVIVTDQKVYNVSGSSFTSGIVATDADVGIVTGFLNVVGHCVETHRTDLFTTLMLAYQTGVLGTQCEIDKVI